MGKAKRFEDLDVWKTARALTNMIYDLSDTGRFAKDFALRDQMRRAAVSVLSNVAEGFESRTQRLFADFLGRAKGSAGEVRAQLYIALDRQYISKEQFRRAYDLADKASRQLARFIQYLNAQPNTLRVQEEVSTYHP